ncbi:MAG: hypothetical protein ACLP5H_13330 [Desulfomonilaceae bacterium]
MAKKTMNAKEILVDIKAGMNNAALMEKYGLSEKPCQGLVFPSNLLMLF